MNQKISSEPDESTPDDSALPAPDADPLDRFDEFWNLVPRKAKKPDARKAFARAVKRAGGPQPIIDGMVRFANDPNLPDPRGPEARFIPHPATWLNNDGWEDEPLPARHGTPDQTRPHPTRPGDLLGILREHRRQPAHIEATIVDTTQELTA